MNAPHLSAPIKLALFLLAGILCLGFGLSLRLDSLEKRPLHADEATGARILADRLESGSYSFDPVHFHGPLLTAAAQPIAMIRQETDWRSLTPRTLRLGIAVVGSLTILLALGFFPWAGFRIPVAAAAFIATSPMLVYYSRVFIHETLFGFLAIGTVLALFGYLKKPHWGTATLLGMVAGLLMATRETFVICFFAWTVAGALIGLEKYRADGWLLARESLRPLLLHGMLAAAAAMVVVAVFYTDWGRQPSGIIGFFATFFLYETVEGHDKPFGYYTSLMLWPKFQGGVWWTEAGIGAAALLGFALSFRQPQGFWIRFLFYAAIAQWLVYSFIAYKTPWLILVAWLHLCLVAGAGVGYLLKQRAVGGKVVAASLFLALLWWQSAQTDRAAHRYASDARNPYAYVPTSTDVEQVGSFLDDLVSYFPSGETGPIAVIGSGYWPLPWYLRKIPATTGYWPVLPENAETFPVLLILPRQMAVANELLTDTHTSLPRGLRVDTRLFLFIRNDIWDAYLTDDDYD